MNKLQQIINELTNCGEYTQEDLAKQIVGETVIAVLATDHTNAVYTTFDQQLVTGTVSRIVDQIRNHWNFK